MTNVLSSKLEKYDQKRRSRRRRKKVKKNRRRSEEEVEKEEKKEEADDDEFRNTGEGTKGRRRRCVWVQHRGVGFPMK